MSVSGHATTERPRRDLPNCAWPRCPHPATLSGYCLTHATQIEHDNDTDDLGSAS
jgi:hypothetical protein